MSAVGNSGHIGAYIRAEMSPSYLSSSLRIIWFEFRNLIGFSSLKVNVGCAFQRTETFDERRT